jgi:hypothetical protein
MGPGERRNTDGKSEVPEYRRCTRHFPAGRAPTFSWPFPCDTLVGPGKVPLAEEHMKEVAHG